MTEGGEGGAGDNYGSVSDVTLPGLSVTVLGTLPAAAAAAAAAEDDDGDLPGNRVAAVAGIGAPSACPASRCCHVAASKAGRHTPPTGEQEPLAGPHSSQRLAPLCPSQHLLHLDGCCLAGGC
jgi:hypothetical protein